MGTAGGVWEKAGVRNSKNQDQRDKNQLWIKWMIEQTKTALDLGSWFLLLCSCFLVLGSSQTALPSCSLFASVLKYAVDTFMVLNVWVMGSKTRFFWMFTLKVRRVGRMEWLRVLPNAVFLPVLTHMRDMRAAIVPEGTVS